MNPSNIGQCDDWTYQHDNDWTHIRDDAGKLVTTFYRKLTQVEVYAFRAGWDVGRDHGRKLGRDEKASEIRKLLSI